MSRIKALTKWLVSKLFWVSYWDSYVADSVERNNRRILAAFEERRGGE
jgi:hypothetical protein